MNYNYLRYFSVLAQVEHYTVAADRLGISQPSLSNAIHNLETELGGIKLFEKVGRNIRLTEAGRYYQERVDVALRELNIASMTLRDSMISAPVIIRMGFVSGMIAGTVAKEIARHTEQNGRIRFRLTENSADELMDMVRSEKLDMAIVNSTNRDRSLHFRKLGQRRLCVALSSEHPLSESPSLSPKQILQEPQIVFDDDYDMENSFVQWGTGNPAEQVICTVNTAQAALDLVEANVGLCIMSTDCVQPRPNIRFVPLENWNQALYMCILYDKWLEPAIWEFVENVVKAIRQMEK